MVLMVAKSVYFLESESVSHSVMSHSLQPLDYNPPGSSVHGILQATGQVGIFLTQGSNPHLLSPALAGGFITASANY